MKQRINDTFWPGMVLALTVMTGARSEWMYRAGDVTGDWLWSIVCMSLAMVTVRLIWEGLT